jgi:hypothetical protein
VVYIGVLRAVMSAIERILSMIDFRGFFYATTGNLYTPQRVRGRGVQREYKKSPPLPILQIVLA